jgi:hypothetical protein
VRNERGMDEEYCSDLLDLRPIPLHDWSEYLYFDTACLPQASTQASLAFLHDPAALSSWGVLCERCGVRKLTKVARSARAELLLNSL